MIALQHLPPGTRLRLSDGTLAVIRQNPRDGVWVVADRLTETGETAQAEDLVHVDDIAEILSSEP